jgi:hypothetical protein
MSSMPLHNAFPASALGLCALASGALALIMPIAPATAATRTVANCNDSGRGSLRAVVTNALDGDTINLGSLGCSRILLIGGEIAVGQNNLELVGRSRYALTIDGNREHRIFRHSGTGTLRLQRVSIANGNERNTEGGCVLSQGSVELIHARVHHCQSLLDGGAIHASNRVLLSDSSAYANIAENPYATDYASGGAIRAFDVVLDRSQVYGNQADFGGGISAGNVTATYSVIRHNFAEAAGGISAGAHSSCSQGCTFTLDKSAVYANRSLSLSGGFDAGATDTLIIDSTVSDNIADDFSAGALWTGARIYNSTIAYNLDTGQCTGAINDRAGLQLVSSIVSRNTCSTGVYRDINIYDDAQVLGSNNIIGVSDVPVPADTIRARPRLGPLTDNGGPTPTRMPYADSPALDRGINPLNQPYDQRGPGFPRVKGGFPDIGAVER